MLDPNRQSPIELRRRQIESPYDFFDRRAKIVSELFEQDRYSIDGIALGMIALGSLAELRYADVTFNSAKDQQRFRRLLTEHCPSFTNRVSIPEMVRRGRAKPEHKRFEPAILGRFPVEGNFHVRQVDEDPLVSAFEAWAISTGLSIPMKMRANDYAGRLFALYRNSVAHSLQVANGREASYHIGEVVARPIFYSNHSGQEVAPNYVRVKVRNADPIEYTRFGVLPVYILQLLQEAIASLRQWATTNDRDLFSEYQFNEDA